MDNLVNLILKVSYCLWGCGSMVCQSVLKFEVQHTPVHDCQLIYLVVY